MDKKEKIINTAIKLFVAQGFENTPTSQISKEAGVATGTMFHHFKTKEDLINASYIFAKRSMLEAVTKDFSDDDPVRESTKKIWCSLLKWGVKNKLLSDFIQKFYNSVYISKIARSEVEKGFERIGMVFVKGVKDKTFKQLPVDLLGELTMGNYYVFVNKYSTIDAKILQKSFEVLWDMLKK